MASQRSQSFSSGAEGLWLRPRHANATRGLGYGHRLALSQVELPTFCSVDSRAGIRARSDQFVTSALFLLAVR